LNAVQEVSKPIISKILFVQYVSHWFSNNVHAIVLSTRVIQS